MEEKKNILSKLNIKDYRNDLELVLEGKQFDEEAKSLLLSIFYKLDNFYKDYMLVKKDSQPKNKFIEDFINIIKLKCKKIEILSPKEFSENKKFIIDKENGEIKCFPNENILFYAIYELNENNEIEGKYKLNDLTNTCVNYVLSKGKIINFSEPIRDFNGYSWSSQIDDAEDITYNLIFQNVLILFGYDFTVKNINKSNIIDILNDKIHKEKLGEKGYKFLKELFEVCIILYNNASKEKHNECVKYKKSLIIRKNMLNNRKEYSDVADKNNAEINKQIKRIDELLESHKSLKDEYERSMKKNRYKFLCLSDFADKLENEKKELLEKIAYNNKMKASKEYQKNQNDCEETLEIYDSIKEEQNKINTQAKILKLQKSFLECEKLKIPKTETKKELYNIARELRYYANIPYKKNTNVIAEGIVLTEFENTTKLLINKMVEEKIIDIGFSTLKLNYEISKYIFRSKIIKLDSIVLKISFIEGSKIQAEYYDGKMLDYKKTVYIPLDEYILNKKDKKIKLLKIGG